MPPHERTWRHPSELAADHRAALVAERPSAAARATALLTGAAGVALVGLAVFALTPRGSDAPLAIGSTPSPAPAAARSPEPSTDAFPLVIPVASSGGRAHLAIAPSRTVTAHVEALRSSTSERHPEPHHAAVAHAATLHTVITVRYPDGSTTPAVVIDPGRDQGLALLEVADSAEQPAYPVARWMPDADELVTVLADEPMVVPFEAVHQLEPDGELAVVNEHGHLIGVCEPGASGGFIGVDVLFADATEPAD